MENSVLQRLRLFIKSKGMTIKYFSETIETPEGTFKSLFQRNSNPTTELIIKILEKYPKLSVNWLLVGVGEMEKENQPQIGKNALSVINSSQRFVSDLQKSIEFKIKQTENNKDLIDRVVELANENFVLNQKLTYYINKEKSLNLASQPPESYGNK